MKAFKLSDYPKPNRDAPEGYFDTLEDRILERHASLHIVRTRFRSRNRRLFAAAAVALLVALTLLQWRPQAASHQDIMEQYLAEQTSISQYDLLTLLDISDLEALQSELPADDPQIESLLSSDIDMEPILTE